MNSMIIQVQLAQIQNVTARLCASSEAMPRVLQAMKMDTNKVGTIIPMPIMVQPIHQLRSLMIQKTMCRFSILRYLAGIE